MEFSSEAERNKTIAIIAFVTALLFVGGGVIASMTPWLMGVQASTQARAVDGLMQTLMFVGGIVFLLVQGLILWAVIFHRRQPGDESDGPNVHGNYALELIWTLIPTIVVFVLTIYSYQVFIDTRAPQENELVVDVTAQRFAFGFEYYDEATETMVSDTVLRTYVEMDENGDVVRTRPVRLQLNSVDVIHAFWIPSMRVKQDMLPGRQTELRFTPTLPGRYPVVCAELCGGGHGGMYSEILVYPSEESYMSWFDTRVDCVITPPEDPAIRGQQILESNFGNYGCAGCHALDAFGWTGAVGPSLNGIADRADARAAAAGDANGHDYLYNSIRNSNAYIVPDYVPAMPVWSEEQMPEDVVEAITAYLLTLGEDYEPSAPTCPVQDFDDIMASYESGGVEVAAR